MPDEGETAWFLTRTHPSGMEVVESGDREHRGVSVYHTDRDCYYLDGKDDGRIVQKTVGKAERRGLSHCLVCAGEATKDNTVGTNCPFCGERVDRLPDHLPCDASPTTPTFDKLSSTFR